MRLQNCTVYLNLFPLLSTQFILQSLRIWVGVPGNIIPCHNDDFPHFHPHLHTLPSLDISWPASFCSLGKYRATPHCHVGPPGDGRQEIRAVAPSNPSCKRVQNRVKRQIQNCKLLHSAVTSSFTFQIQ
jgi:hypothetical protein